MNNVLKNKNSFNCFNGEREDVKSKKNTDVKNNINKGGYSMNKNIVLIGENNFTITEALEKYALKKIKKLDRFNFLDNSIIKMFFNAKHNHKFTIKLNYKKNVIVISKTSKDMYKSIDLCVDAVVRKLRKTKEKQISSRRKSERKREKDDIENDLKLEFEG